MNTMAEETKAFCNVLIAAGCSLLGVAAGVVGLCVFLSAIAHDAERLPGGITMAVGLSVGLIGMIVTAYNSESGR